MSNPNERSNADNVNNFEELIAVCIDLGPAYNPSNPAITIPSMTASLAATRASMQTVNTQEALHEDAVNVKADTIAPLKSIAQRVMAAANASPLTMNQKADIRSIVLKLTGRRATTPMPDPANPGATVSASQLGFDQRVENLDRLIQLLATMPAYNPNEPELTVAGLTAFHASQVAVNTAEAVAKQPLASARTVRNNLIYRPPSGITYLAMDVKNYVKSVFGNNSPEHKRVTAIKFVKRRI